MKNLKRFISLTEISLLRQKVKDYMFAKSLISDDNGYLSLKEHDSEVFDRLSLITYLGNKVIEGMDEEALFFLENDTKDTSKYWYEHYYSRATYYRKRQQIYSKLLASLKIINAI